MIWQANNGITIDKVLSDSIGGCTDKNNLSMKKITTIGHFCMDMWRGYGNFWFVSFGHRGKYENV